LNFARRSECNRCQTPRADGGGGGGGGRSSYGGGGKHEFIVRQWNYK